MNIHEHQAKTLLASHNVPVPQGGAVEDLSSLPEVLSSLRAAPYVVKAQIHAGGRGKAGGVKVTPSHKEAINAAEGMFGKTLVTHQTGPQGREVRRVYVEEGTAIERELYISLLIDRHTSRLSVVASVEGGMDIEEVAQKTPEKIETFSIDPASGPQPFHARRLSKIFGLEGALAKEMGVIFPRLCEAFLQEDMSMLEINPFVVTKEQHLICLDAKVSLDENALFRHPSHKVLRDVHEEDPAEVEASKYDLNYIRLDGNIACMVNGAGLAMATMDMIKLYGGEPANFLDVGGGASEEKVTEAFRIIVSDKNVAGILVNIFGGIMRCDTIAAGIIAAVTKTGLDIPLVVRLEGTNVELGKKALAESGLKIIAAEDLDDAARKIVEASGK